MRSVIHRLKHGNPIIHFVQQEDLRHSGLQQQALLMQKIIWISGVKVMPLPAYRVLILRRPFLRMLIRSTPSTCSAYRLSRFPSAGSLQEAEKKP